MDWETDKLYIKLSESSNKYGIGPHIIKSFHEYGITRSEENNPTNYLIEGYSQETFYNNLIPHCNLYPKFEYESHLDKIRRIKTSKNLGISLSNKKPSVIIFFVSIDVYDKITSLNKLDIKDYFGHIVIDLLFFQAKKFASIVGTRCVVVWIGIRDCLSQESLFSKEIIELQSDIGAEDNNNRQKQKFIDSSCLDKCITNLLVDYSIDSFEAKNEFEASQYLLSIISGLHEVQKRPISSKYKPKNTSGTNSNPWITQIMQIPGLSDDSARGIENAFKTPKELIRFITDNIARQGLISSKPSLFFESLYGHSSTLDIENSSWFSELANISYFCSKGFCIRKIGKARARKLVILYGNLSFPSKMIGEQIY
ncbi:hypothetical protein [Cryptosporidium parvum Iowa II]|uniref:Uncharacterized protein n=2 Tax=Cryptosporidium parvum TaxID=5807 RepID=Q5CXC3_CRYPI|nr:hypothetical protein [Cryptosporidium parvum Iowa II]QOY41044.1 Uncharacterized protein CPATCC_0013140 [Cryptosporidium parvum]WKS78273.1 hypothetical protein CPCDC_6g1640 [Cryptosporidium sp. 43IA8]EAK89834.1 hypothetical protein cgd6_1640 [Cryptosporidium parvum Iowa II]WRK32763.1 Uncharacterized protein cpbgf_6001640 [Cryptosporidium parvum]CAD98708.1 hypothetical predicted protein, unknown function [Cryptosporidium parvum]|eukprot:QOY41044.1 hypothetical protein CPATCC_002686 [Cryptosporidium parvum]